MRIKQPGQNARRVRFHDRNSLIESEAGNGVRYIFTDSRQFPHLIDPVRKFSAMAICDSLAGGVEILGACVVTEALPGMQDIIFRRRGKRREMRETPQPALVIWNYSRDLRLLKHKLGNQDAIRIPRPAPWKIAPLPAIPAQEGALEGADCFRCSRESQTRNVQRATANVQFRVERWACAVPRLAEGGLDVQR